MQPKCHLLKVLLGAAVIPAVILAAYSPASRPDRGEIAGTITNEIGQPLGGVTVMLIDADHRLIAVTGSAGTFRFSDQLPGTYTLSVSRPGYVPAVHGSVGLAGGAVVDLPIGMRRATDGFAPGPRSRVEPAAARFRSLPDRRSVQ